MISKKLQEKINRELSEEEIKKIYTSYKKYNLIRYFFTYITNSKFRQAVSLHNWIKEFTGNEIIEAIAAECTGTTYDDTVKNVIRYWYTHLRYVSDQTNYGTAEYWADPEEILEKGSDDCDGFATMIYLTCIAAGVPDYRMYFTIGYVNSNNRKIGHAYVKYIADDLIMYPLDGTFYPKDSMKFSTPYFNDKRYYYGEQEWACFNMEGTYKIK